MFSLAVEVAYDQRVSEILCKKKLGSLLSDTISHRLPNCWTGTSPPSTGRCVATAALGATAPNRLARSRPIKHKIVAMPVHCLCGCMSKFVCCFNFNGAQSRLRASCPSAMKRFTCAFMPTRPRVKFFGKTCAVRSKRRNAMPVGVTAGGRSPTEDL